jgi:hypothetical protein
MEKTLLNISELANIVRTAISKGEQPPAIKAVVVSSGNCFSLENGEILTTIEGEVLNFSKFRRRYESPIMGSQLLCSSSDASTGISAHGEIIECATCRQRPVCAAYGSLVVLTKEQVISVQIPPQRVSGVEYQFLAMMVRGQKKATCKCVCSNKTIQVNIKGE